MFDFDAGKLLIIGVVALIVIGPKDLPRVLRQVGQWAGRLRRMASEFQGQFMDAMKEADLQDIREEVSKLKSHTDLSTHFDPARDIQRELTQAVSEPPPPKTVGKSFSTPAATPPAEASEPTFAATSPSAVEDEIPAVGFEGGIDANKRKLVLRKRKPQTPAVAASPYRNVRPRRQEADQ